MTGCDIQYGRAESHVHTHTETEIAFQVISIPLIFLSFFFLILLPIAGVSSIPHGQSRTPQAGTLIEVECLPYDRERSLRRLISLQRARSLSRAGVGGGERGER
jgi:hypothetical protein